MNTMGRKSYWKRRREAATQALQHKPHANPPLTQLDASNLATRHDVSFYSRTASKWALATTRTTWESTRHERLISAGNQFLDGTSDGAADIITWPTQGINAIQDPSLTDETHAATTTLSCEDETRASPTVALATPMGNLSLSRDTAAAATDVCGVSLLNECHSCEEGVSRFVEDLENQGVVDATEQVHTTVVDDSSSELNDAVHNAAILKQLFDSLKYTGGLYFFATYPYGAAGLNILIRISQHEAPG